MYYSKNSPSKHGETIIIPENYSGNAFRSDGEADPSILHKESKDTADTAEAAETAVCAETEETNDGCSFVQNEGHSGTEGKEGFEDDGRRKKNSFLSFLLPPRSKNSSFSLLHDIDMEDMIIIILLFLMYQNDSDDDVTLLLLLLLFLK